MSNQPPYTLSDVLLLLGQCTVELAWLRGRVAELEAKLAERSDNSTVTQAEVTAAKA